MTKPLDIIDEPQGGPSRTPLILGIVAGVLTVAVIIALVLLVTRPSGDTTAPPAPGQSEPEQQPAPQQPAPDESEAPATTGQVAVDGLGLTITQTDGTELTHAWADDSAPAIEALTELFGEAPTEDFQNGDAENWAYDIYVWDGFRLYDVFLGDGGRSRDEVPAPTYVAITGNAPTEVGIVDEFGVLVGDSMDKVRGLDPTDEVELSDGRVRIVLGNGRGTFYNDGKRAFNAFVESDASAQTVASITYTFRARGQ
jgi:hypothetical protein